MSLPSKDNKNIGEVTIEGIKFSVSILSSVDIVVDSDSYQRGGSKPIEVKIERHRSVKKNILDGCAYLFYEINLAISYGERSSILRSIENRIKTKEDLVKMIEDDPVVGSMSSTTGLKVSKCLDNFDAVFSMIEIARKSIDEEQMRECLDEKFIPESEENAMSEFKSFFVPDNNYWKGREEFKRRNIDIEIIKKLYKLPIKDLEAVGFFINKYLQKLYDHISRIHMKEIRIIENRDKYSDDFIEKTAMRYIVDKVLDELNPRTKSYYITNIIILIILIFLYM